MVGTTVPNRIYHIMPIIILNPDLAIAPSKHVCRVFQDTISACRGCLNHLNMQLFVAYFSNISKNNDIEFPHS